VSATRLATTERPRAFAALAASHELRAVRLDASLRADAVRDAGAHLSPSLGASWRAGALALHARASQGFRVPSFYDLYVASAVAAEARAVRPERVTLDAEAGSRLGGDAVALSGAAFMRRTRDAIVWLPGSFSWSPRNVEHEVVTGAEARLVAAADMFSAEGWAGAYRTRARIEGYDVPTPYAARAAGGATIRAAHRSLELSASLTALGRRQYVTAPASRALELPGVATVDLTLSHRTRLRSARLLSVAGVRNIGDVRWEPVRRFPSPGRNWVLGLTITS
jgi:outer membrane cobalamin receptor